MQPNRSVDGYRSLPNKGPYLRAALLALIHYLAGISAITLGAILIIHGGRDVMVGFVAAVIVVAVSWLFGYFLRSSAKCPLCKGTPLLNNVASKHRDAERLWPLNHGTTAQLKLLMTHRFRCMFCGTGFDLLRKSSSRRDPGERP